MRRFATSALAAALVMAGVGGAQAQDTMGRRASLFDLGIYGGGAWTSDWFTIAEDQNSDEEEGYAVGFAPIFGATATFWLSPQFGIRAHGAYMPSNLPEGEGTFADDQNDNYVMNNWFYDLNLVYRPFFWSSGGLMSSMYLFAGGGGLTTNVAGDVIEGQLDCIPVAEYLLAGVCLSSDPSYATVGQGVVGLGFDVASLAGLGVFIEGAVHGYDSPAHVFENDSRIEDEAHDKFAFTPRLVLGLKAMFGNILPPPVVETPPPPPVTPVTPVTPPPPTTQPISVCVIQGGTLQNVTAQYNTASGDTTVNGTPFATAFPAGADYAAGATWYINNEPITFNGRRYVKYGLPRVLGVTEVSRVGDFMGVGVYAEAGATGTPDVIYIPVRPGCEFQPYQYEVKTGGVRGE